MKESIQLTLAGLAVAGIMAAGMYIPSASQTLPASLTREEISWNAFCLSRGYDPDIHPVDVVDEYLDTWVGSAEEDMALINHGLEP